MTLAMSGHGTLLEYQATPGGAFTAIAELGDITPPALSRNEFDATTQEKDIDFYVLGVLRRSAFTTTVNFLPDDGSHDETSGFYSLIIANTFTGFRITFPTTPPVIWVLSGQVQSITPHAPVDDRLSADVTFRFSGAMKINEVTIT